jgi:protein-L-isoaspartate(D-aspartate) O-methyltransferase
MQNFLFNKRTIYFLVCLFICPVITESADRYQKIRFNMVREFIENEGVSNPRVLKSMRDTPRHMFVPTSQKKHAYEDGAFPIGSNQTISPPYIVAYMTEKIDPQPTDKVLEIGTGSGYQAAVLSPLVKDVYTIEIVEKLGRTAARTLKRLKYENVHTKIGDGYKGWAEHAPFDKIIVTCSPEKIPGPLIKQLKEGGIMLIPLGERYQQVFHLFKKKDGNLERTELISTFFVPMTGVSEENREVLPDPANPKIRNGNFELDENKDGRVDNWHYQRQVEMVSGNSDEGEHWLKFTNTEPGKLSQLLQCVPVDGRKISAIKLSLSVKHENTAKGSKNWEKPGLYLHYYSQYRNIVGENIIGSLKGSSDWYTIEKIILIPPKTREVIFRAGLNGGTGMLGVDNLQIKYRTRKR